MISLPLICIILGILGLIVGSFLNVVIVRQQQGTSIGGRSHCPHCKKQLSWYELIPVVSFLIQHGTCRSCSARISRQYPTVELITGILFGFSGWFLLIRFFDIEHITASIIGGVAFLAIIAIGIAIAVYDSRTRLVPLTWFISLVAVSVVFLVVQIVIGYNGFFWPAVIPHLIGILVAVPFLFLWIISKGKWIGFADIEIIAWMGLFLGIAQGVSAVLVAFYLGAIFALFFIGARLLRGDTYASLRKIPIAFAPFLLVAWFVTVVTGWNIVVLFALLFL